MVSAKDFLRSRDARQGIYLKQYAKRGVILSPEIMDVCSKLDEMNAVVMISGTIISACSLDMM